MVRMITFLEGVVEDKDPTRVVLNVSGVGYEVFIPLSSYDRLPAEGVGCKILIYDHVREDIHSLYGFLTADERRMFLMLLNISGIGPKLALTALSGLSIRDLKAAIAQADVKRLSSISGIGKKTAERIVVELRDKLGAGEAMEAVTAKGEMTPENIRTRDAILALISLGYKQADAQQMVRQAVAGAKPDATVEEVVRRALAR
jgi:holliday junction DNA helicase RuvA